MPAKELLFDGVESEGLAAAHFGAKCSSAVRFNSDCNYRPMT
jgi:hypothetical protein